LAYSLNDVYRYLRVVMRIDAFVLGAGLGLLLAVTPSKLLAAWGVYVAGPMWPVRLAGGLLITVAVMLFLSSQDRIVGVSSMIGLCLGNGIVSFVLLVAYLQQQFTTLGLFGRLLLILVFVVCLVSTLFPVHYLRAEYQAP
jgi:NAD(P)-dependent dehydrogenase (short-subunit alcohol dehydrogenase family)